MTGKLKTFDEIHDTHDKLHLAMEHIHFESEVQRAHFMGCAAVCCWLLGHETTDSMGEEFQNNLLKLEFQLLEQGIEFKRPNAEPSQGAD